MNNALLVGLSRTFARQVEGVLTDLGIGRIDAKSVEEACDLMPLMPVVVVVLHAQDGPGEVMRSLSLLPLAPTQRVVIFADDQETKGLLADVESDKIACFPPDFDSPALRNYLRRSRRKKPKDGGARRFGQMLGDCQAMREVYTLIAKVAPTDASVLICGESGTGKELVANAIHQRSDRSDAPFVAINCGAIAENLIESELFGHEKGSFTGAQKAHPGVFEQADGGTLFLDEITEMPLEMQVQLLRVLETQAVRRLGSEKDIDVDVRVLAATNRDPQASVDEGRLREDLMFRLAVFPITLPPLRKRGDDVTMIARFFLSTHNQENDTAKQLSALAESRLRAYDWPGNVRQLRNIIHRAFIIESEAIDLDCLVDLIEVGEPASCDNAVNADNEVSSYDEKETSGVRVALPPATSTDPSSDSGSVQVPVGTTIDEAEKQLILKTMQELDSDKPEVARVLGISLKTLYNRLNSYQQDA